MSSLPVTLLLLPISAASLIVLLGWLGRRVVSCILLAGAAGEFALALVLAQSSAPPQVSLLAALRVGEQRFDLIIRSDGLATLIVLLLSAAGLLVAMAIVTYWSESLNKAAIILLLALANAGGLALAANLSTLYVFAALLDLILLVALVTSLTPARRLAATRMYATVEIAALPLLLTIAVLAGGRFTDAWSSVHGVGGLLSLGVLFGAVVRAGFAPVQAWLTGVLAESDWPNAALVALCMPLAGMVVLLRLLGPLAQALPVRDILLVLGMISLAVACYYVLRPDQRRRAVAGLVLAQLGFFALGLALDRPEGYQSALDTLVFSALTLPVLVVLLGALESLGNRRLLSAGSLPNLLFVVAMLAAAGLPPFFGFQTRVYLLQALLTSGAFLHILGMIAVLLASGLLAAAVTRSAVAVLAEFSVSETPWWPHARLVALPLVASVALVAVPAAAPGLLQSWLLLPVVSGFAGTMGSQGAADFGYFVAGALLLLALFAGSLPLLSPGKPALWPSLPLLGGARLAGVFSAVERWRERGFLDPCNLAAQGVLGFARGVAFLTDSILGRLAI